MKNLVHQWFLYGLVVCFVIGFVFCETLDNAARNPFLRQSILATVMFIMAWPLATSLVLRTLAKPWPAILASCINLGLIPLLAMPLSLFQSPGLAVGLIVTAATPCTLASAAVWTRRAGGNDAMAMLTTVITNGLCFVITPMWIFVLARNTDVEISMFEMMSRLLLLVLLPMTLAQLSRLHPTVARQTTANKRSLSVIAQLGILMMVIIGAVETGLRVAGQPLPWQQLILLLVTCVVLHFGVLFFGFQMSKWLRFDRGDQIAVAFAGSQKTLMVGLVLCLQVGASVLPIVVFHAIQLIGDTPIADWFRRSGKEAKNPKH